MQFKVEEESLENKIKSLEKQLEFQNAGVEQQRYSLDCTRKQLEAYEKVFSEGASSKTECLDARVNMEGQEKQLTMAEAQARQLSGQLESTKHALAQLRSKNSMQLTQLDAAISDIAASAAQVNIRMRNAERTLSEAHTAYDVALRAARATKFYEENEITNLKKQIEQLKASISSQEHSYLKGELRSPVDGKVALLNVRGSGEVVEYGQNLLSIVPSHEKLVACLYVPNEQIAFLSKNELVKLQFPAYPYQQYGTIAAKVVLIDEFPSQEKEHATAYKVYLEPQRDWIICRGKKIRLRKGLDVEGQILLRKRRLLIQVLAPILKLQYSHFKS